MIGPDADFKLTDLLSSASATIGIIIAGSIFLQLIHGRSTDLLQRYKNATGEYRTQKASDRRRSPLELQIRMFRRRLQLLDWASWLATVAVLAMVIAVLMGGVEALYSQVIYAKYVGAASILFGLVLIGSAVVLHLVESILGRHEVDRESEDLDKATKEPKGAY